MKKKTVLGISLLFMFFSCLTACGKTDDIGEGKVRVSFDTCTDYETNLIEDQIIDKGSKATKPEVIFPTDLNRNQKVFAWYTEKTYETEWNFSNAVNKSMTLYAKWAETCTIKYYLKGDTLPVWTISNVIKGKTLELHDELCDGYKFNGYFSDSDCTVPFDLTKVINEDTSVYIDRSKTIYLNARSIKRRFRMVAAGATGSSAGYIGEVVTSGSEEYIDVNFGFSKSKDPYMNIVNPQLNISKSQKIKIEFKNMGGADNIKFYWVAKLADGSFVNNRQSFSEDNAWNYNFSSDEKYMEDSDGWLVKEFDVSEKIIHGVSSWANCVTLVSLRIQAGNDTRDITANGKYILTPRFIADLGEKQARQTLSDFVMGDKDTTKWTNSWNGENISTYGMLDADASTELVEVAFRYRFEFASSDLYPVFGFTYDGVNENGRVNTRLDLINTRASLRGYIYGGKTSLGNAGADGTRFEDGSYSMVQGMIYMLRIQIVKNASDFSINLIVESLGNGLSTTVTKNFTYNSSERTDFSNPLFTKFCINAATYAPMVKDAY